MIKDFHLMQECAGVERVERDDIIIYSVQQKQSDNMLFLQRLNRTEWCVCVTCEVLSELLLQLGGSVEGFPALLLRQALVHLPAGTNNVSGSVFQVPEKSYGSLC